MKALSKLREKLFPKSETGISAVFHEDGKSSQPAPRPESESTLSAADERNSDSEILELTPELEAALFPKTPLMISATFKPSKAKETPPEASRENRHFKIEDEKEFPII